MRDSRLMTYRKTLKREGNSQDYETIWYCIRLGSEDTFPDGNPVPAQRWKTLKPIWIRLGEGVSWAKAITFGPAKGVLEDAANKFGAKQIVWLDRKNRTVSSEICQDSRPVGMRAAISEESKDRQSESQIAAWKRRKEQGLL